MKTFVAALLCLAALSGCLGGPVGQEEHVPDDGLGSSVARPPSTPPEEVPPAWPALADATVRPGVQVVSSAGQCTSNFLFRSPDNSTLYLGVAAHCFGEGESTDTNGCDTSSLPLGSAATVEGGSAPAVLVYSSWLAMQEAGESHGPTCRANDFAIVQLDAADRGWAHPAMLHFGGPTALATGGASAGSRVLTYGNTGLRPGPTELDEREGYVIQTQDDGWTHTIYTLGPGLPGDSGSGVLTSDGQALGILVTLAIAPLAGSNGVTNLEKALSYANSTVGLQLELTTWKQLDSGILPG